MIGVKGLDMVRWPAPHPGDPFLSLFLLCLPAGLAAASVLTSDLRLIL